MEQSGNLEFINNFHSILVKSEEINENNIYSINFVLNKLEVKNVIKKEF